MYTIRPAEPADLAQVRALIGQAPWEATIDAVIAEEMGHGDQGVHRLVAVRGAEVLAVAKIVAGVRARSRHRAELYLASRDDAAALALVRWVVDVSWRWLALLRLDVTLRVSDPFAPVLADAGFAPWVRRPGGWCRGGVVEDLLTWGAIRGDLPPPVHGSRTFERPRQPRLGAVEVRPSRAEDAQAQVRILAHPSVMWGTQQTGTTPAETWRTRFASSRHTYTALHEGEFIGNGGLFPAGPDREHVTMLGISVSPEAQGLGAGETLMRHLIQAADRAGFARIELLVWADNSRAEALYRKCGFVDDGTAPYAAWRDGEWAHDRYMGRTNDGGSSQIPGAR